MSDLLRPITKSTVVSVNSHFHLPVESKSVGISTPNPDIVIPISKIGDDPHFISSEDEAVLELKSQMTEVAWPIDDEGYLDALDADAKAQP